MPGRAAGVASTLGPLGLLKAPGTWGSLAGVIFCGFVLPWLCLPLQLVLCAVLVYLAIGICDRAEEYFEMRDPGKINLDEFVAMPVCYLGVIERGVAFNSHLIWWLIAGFLLFRFFDILKPLGISKVQKLDGGLGCVMDDVAAALVVCLILNVAAAII